MEIRANYVAVGAFVLLILLGLFVAVLWLARVQFHEEFVHVDTYFEGTVTGLTPGALVRFNGIEVGRVEDIALDPNNPKQVVVTLQVSTRIDLREDTVTSLETQGLTGLSYVLLSGGSPTAPPLSQKSGQRYPIIRSKPSALQAMFSSTPEIMAQLVTVTDRVAKLLDDKNRQAIADTIDNVREITANIRNTTDIVGKHADDIDRLIADGTRTMHNLANATQAIEGSLNQVKSLLAKAEPVTGKLDQALGTFNETGRKVNLLLGDADALLQSSNPQIKEFMGNGLNQVTMLLGDTRVMMSSLTRVLKELERDPTRFLFGDRREGFKPQ